ncbi:hypothetical protein HDU89_006162 [Geranomyces variabilis]|nr:hypothetical protein HDU89_006162 [Geranomyces variabilis]
MDTADIQQTAAATAAHALPPAYSLLPTTTSTTTTGSGHQPVSLAAVASSDSNLALASTIPLPAYDDHEHGGSDASALALASDDKKSRAAVSPPGTTIITHYVLETDTLPGLSLKYNVPIDAIRRVNSLFSDATLPARSKLLIPSPSSSSSSSLSPTPPATDERKRLVKRFQLVAKCIDADEAWSYMRQNEFMLEQALEQWWADVKWERENGAVAAAARGVGQLNSSSSSSGKWKKGMGL